MVVHRAMAQTSEDYWGKRMTEREAQWYAKSQQTIEKEMADYYLQAASRIRNDIAVLYARFAADNGIDKVAAQQLIQGDEYRVWRMEMKDYLKQVQITGDKNLLLELNTLAMRSRISRLDKIYGDTMMECAKLAGKIDSRMGAFLGDAFKDNYYHGIYDIGQKMQIRTPIAAMNNEMVDKVLRTPWSGKNYSQRIWKDSDKLAQTIQREMVDAVHRGASVQQMSRMVQDRMQVGRSDATRLVRTELNYVQTQAALDSIRDAGMKYVKFLATLDDRTSEVCQQHDGKIIPIEDAKPGVNIPPLHPHCRSTITGSLKGDSLSKGKRAARDADGKYMRVPADMNYEEWKRSYIDKAGVESEIGIRAQSSSLPAGKYNLAVRRQVQNRHITGTMEYERYVDKMRAEGMAPSVLADKDNVRSLIDEFHGKGIYAPSHIDGSPREYVDVGHNIGQYWDRVFKKLVDTTFIMIVYSKKGTHIYPIKPRGETK